MQTSDVQLKSLSGSQIHVLVRGFQTKIGEDAAAVMSIHENAK